tara:strand:- start:5389 stop:6093 length:705 start_codon:yes stop_codon:yes gene_type:complete
MDLKNRIRVALGLDTEVKLGMQDKLVDGTIVVSEADTLEVGIDVSVLAEDGTTILLAPGEYELESGVKFVVAEEGIVSEVLAVTEEVAPEGEVVEAEATPNADEAEADFMVRCIAEGGTEETCALAWTNAAPAEEVVEEALSTPKRIKETKEYSFADEELIGTLASVVSELLEEAKAEIEKIKAEVAAINAEPAADDVNLNKFSNNGFKELTKRELGKLSPKERVRYSLESLKK